MYASSLVGMGVEPVGSSDPGNVGVLIEGPGPLSSLSFCLCTFISLGISVPSFSSLAFGRGSA